MIRASMLVVLCLSLSGCASTVAQKDVLFQASTFPALLAGAYEGDMTVRKLSSRGDTGIGTFNAFDGEMIALDGVFYQLDSSAHARVADESAKTPFAQVSFFEADKSVDLPAKADCQALGTYIDSVLPTPNIFYVIKVEGVFSYVKARSIAKLKKPYPDIQKVVERQSVTEFHNRGGTLVGVRVPAYASGLNQSGYHFHFITDTRSSGGHVLECSVAEAKAHIDYTHGFEALLPQKDEFYRAALPASK